MRQLYRFAILGVLFLSLAGGAHAQFEPGTTSFRPEFGFGIANTFGVSFGGSMTYDLSERTSVGPFFTFSTAGRKWKGDQDNQSYETKGSNSMVFGGRVYYLFKPEADYPWYVNGGIGIVRFGSVKELDGGGKITFNNEELEIKSATKIAVNLGTGTIFPIGDNLNLVIDANSYIGSQGDVKGKTNSQDDIDLSQFFEGGAFWLLHFTVGLSFTL
jgi:hypothetical protein